MNKKRLFVFFTISFLIITSLFYICINSFRTDTEWEKRNITISSIQSISYGNVILDNSNFNIVEGSKAFSSDNFNIEFGTNATSLSPVGYYDLILAYKNNNYNITLHNTSKVLIIPRQITISLLPSESIYGDPIILNDSYEIVSGSMVNNDNLNLVFATTANANSNVGIYDISCQGNANYNINLTN